MSIGNAIRCGKERNIRKLLAAVPVLALVSIAGASNADAIECRDDYQVVQGQLLATPYCADGYLAKVARGYGVRVSAREIRNNPNKKAEVCRFMGHDTRISHICQQYRNGRPGFGR